MEPKNLQSMTIDALWGLHEEISLILTAKLKEEKSALEQRLVQLNKVIQGQSFGTPGLNTRNAKAETARRPYPRVYPKFRNPVEPAETWSGRGKQPRWLTAQLKAGKKIDDFRIKTSAGAGTKRRRAR